MYATNQREAQRQRSEEIRQEIAADRLRKTARENRETRPYVVRDLSWELVRYLQTEASQASAFAHPVGANSNQTSRKRKD